MHAADSLEILAGSLIQMELCFCELSPSAK